ncbi:MAG: amidohydrolase [Bacteroidetes bacterium]|nr:amidohydrolase [Bacteroidota bacterium]MBU1720722.1 amidohydrolase [Bacteroidota bacterium]
MQDLTVILVQADLIWENPAKNHQQFSDILTSSITASTDLVILPEMFSTGFSMESPRLAETMRGISMQWLTEMAAKHKVVITGSLIIEENGQYYNRLIWMRPDGSYSCYNKRHLFRMAGEHKHFAAGNSQLIVELKGWKIRPVICYDLRFPVWSRNRFSAESGYEYDFMFFVANWPKVRRDPWMALLKARAIENLAFVAGVNRVGSDCKDIEYSGDSGMYNFRGELITQMRAGETIAETVTLSAAALHEFREKFPAGKDADQFDIR